MYLDIIYLFLNFGTTKDTTYTAAPAAPNRAITFNSVGKSFRRFDIWILPFLLPIDTSLFELLC
jgi:hypothetical protein